MNGSIPGWSLARPGLRQGGHAQSLVGDSAPKPVFISLHRVQIHGGCSGLVTLSRNGELERGMRVGSGPGSLSQH